MAAVNCDDDSNKALCGQMGVQGFPTLKLVVPSKKPGKPKVEDYQGARSAKAIVDAVVEKIPNHVKRVTDKDVTDWLATENDTAKAILFTEKGTTSALLRALAIEFLGSINFGQIRNKESSAVQTFGIGKFPTLVLLPGGEQDSLVYDGEMNKKDMVAFLSQVAEPNSASAQGKNKRSKTSKETSTASADDATESTTEAPEDKNDGEESAPSSRERPAPAPPLPILLLSDDIRKSCLSAKSGICVLAMTIPDSAMSEFPGALEAFTSLAEIKHKHDLRKAKIFPFYSAPGFAEEVGMLKNKLDLKFDQGVEVIAINTRRGWWLRYDAGEGGNFGVVDMEAWVDAIRLGEGEKQKLPEGIVQEEKAAEPETEQASSESEEPKEPEPEAEPQPGRDEL